MTSQHIYLIGFRGSGKTTCGTLIAKHLDLPKIDTDQVISAQAGTSITTIFNDHGEAYFRDLESEAIRAIHSLKSRHVVSLGGGAVLREDNRSLIALGQVIWLTGSPQTHFEHILGDQGTSEQRPALTQNNDYDEVVAILEHRRPIYESLAQKIVAIDDRSPDEIGIEIVDWLTSADEVKKTTS